MGVFVPVSFLLGHPVDGTNNMVENSALENRQQGSATYKAMWMGKASLLLLSWARK